MIRSDRAVFRLPGVSLIIPFLLFVCVTPLATAGPKFWLALYIFPIAGLAYILLTRTVADGELIRTTGLTRGSRLSWAELDGFEFHGPRWAIAVGTDGRRVRLPMVRPRDLPRLARVSGGRLLLGRDAPSQDSPTGIAPTGATPTDEAELATSEPQAHESASAAGETSAPPTGEPETEGTVGFAVPTGPTGPTEPTGSTGLTGPSGPTEPVLLAVQRVAEPAAVPVDE